MSRIFPILNLLGVLALAGLCVVQWDADGRLNREVNRLEQTRIEHAAKVAEQERAIRGYASDLDDFRGRIERADDDLKESEAKLADRTAEVKRLHAERDELLAQRDQLQATLDKWVAAVAERDRALKQAGSRIEQFAKERNDAILKFNDLAGKYNGVVKDLNDARAKQGKEG